MSRKLRQQLHYASTFIALKVGLLHPILRFILRRQSRRFGCQLLITEKQVEVRKGRRAMILAPTQSVYGPTVSEHFETFFTALVPESRGDMSVLDFSTPKLHTYRGSGLQFELTSFPEEPDALAAYARHYKPRPGDLIFDVGAHCGVSTFQFAREVGPTGRVIAFEPDPQNFEILLRNVSRHKLTNVTPVRAAIAERTGTATFFSEGTLASCLAQNSTRATIGADVQVETFSLADAFARWGTPRFCKLDIEGSEVEVLNSSRDLIRLSSTLFVVDTSHIVEGELSVNAVEQAFRSAGLDVESADKNGMITWAWPKPAAALKSTA